MKNRNKRKTLFLESECGQKAQDNFSADNFFN